MATDLLKHRILLGAVLGLQFLTCWVPYFRFFSPSPVLQESWLSSVSTAFSSVLVLFWTWLMAIGLIGVGVYWSTEVNDRFALEAWRHASFQSWIGQKIRFVLLLNAVVYGLTPLPFLLVSYPGEGVSVLLLTAFLFLYSTHLSVLFLLATLLGAKTAYAFTGTLSYHVLNLLLDGVGWPNTLQYFLIGEQAGIASLAIVTGLLVLMIGMMIGKTIPTTITKRGSEYQ